MDIKLPLLWEYTQGFVENMLIQLEDCCKYKDQGIIFIVDRNNSEYLQADKFEALGSFLFVTLENGKSSIIVVSKSVAARVAKLFDKSLGALGWNVKKLEDFYILTHSGKNFTGIDIQLSKLPDVSWDEVKKYTLEPENEKPMTDVLSKLFVTLPEKIKDSSSRPITSWMIYLIGHGFAKNSISGFSIKEFKNIIDYFQKKIKTKIFIYNSCFSGGVNKNLAFEKDPSMDLEKRCAELVDEINQIDTKNKELLKQIQDPNVPAQKRGPLVAAYNDVVKKINNKVDELEFMASRLNSSVNIEPIEQKTYTFPIIVTSSTDAPTITSLNVSKDSGGIIKFSSNVPLFDKMFNALSQEKTPNYYNILSSAQVFSSPKSKADNPEIMISNIPQIRLPGLDTFSMELLKNSQETQDFMVISKTQAQTRDKELKIKETAKSVFVYPVFVPFAVTFPTKFNNSVRFVFIDSSDAYRFKMLNAPNMTFEDLCRIFAPLAGTKKITLYIDKLIFNEKKSDGSNKFDNVIFEIGTDDTPSQLFRFKLTAGGKVFSAETKENELFNTAIAIKNILKKDIIGESPNYIPSEKLKEIPVHENLNTILAKRQASLR